LAALVDEFDVIPSDFPEDVGDDPVAEAVRLAIEKAQAVGVGTGGAVVVGSDTVVFDESRSYGKPADDEDARAMLSALSGRTHRVATGVAVVSQGAAVRSGVSISTVRMAPMDARAIESYVASGRPLDKAGAYAIQDEDVPTVADLEGCYCCVMGLPLWRLRVLLLAAGVDCRDPGVTFARCAGCPERPA
jgi:septum formation protein